MADKEISEWGQFEVILTICVSLPQQTTPLNENLISLLKETINLRPEMNCVNAHLVGSIKPEGDDSIFDKLPFIFRVGETMKVHLYKSGKWTFSTLEGDFVASGVSFQSLLDYLKRHRE